MANYSVSKRCLLNRFITTAWVNGNRKAGKVLGILGKANDAGEMEMDDLAKIELASACHG